MSESNRARVGDISQELRYIPAILSVDSTFIFTLREAEFPFSSIAVRTTVCSPRSLQVKKEGDTERLTVPQLS